MIELKSVAEIKHEAVNDRTHPLRRALIKPAKGFYFFFYVKALNLELITRVNHAVICWRRRI